MEYYSNNSYQPFGAVEGTGTAGATGTTGATELGKVFSQSPQQAQSPQSAQQPQPPQGIQQPGRAPLTPQPFLPKKGNYQNLLVYKKAVIIYDLTFYFAHHYFVARKDRTVDQLVQAARSGKQNIVEGCAAASTSSETELKLFSVARASMQEVLEDYSDYLRTRGLNKWTYDDPRTVQTWAFCRQHSAAADYTKNIEQRSPETLCNIAITLIHQYDRMMEKLLNRTQKDFVEHGGILERMTAARLGYRNEQKTRIAELEAENSQLKTRIARLEALLTQKGGEL